jgi:copper resistance protein C
MRMFTKPLFALVLSLIAMKIHAEGVLIKSEPKNNAELRQFDGTVTFWFSGNVGNRSPSVVVVDATGHRVDNGDTRLVLGERHRLTATTKPLTPGAYAMRYRVVTEDGLIVSGVSKFALLDTSGAP